MQSPDAARRGLKILCLACLALLPACLAAFAVNLELALRVFFPGAVWLEGHLPAAGFRRLAVLALDLSTVSTAVPVLLLAFPLAQGWRVLRRPADDREFPRTLSAAPYPPHFAFFLVMLGLVGTLHGLWIGLRASGVAELGGAAPSPETIQAALDRLMSGTATAILSSLVGIIAAFFAAKPIPWLFRRLVGIEQEDSRRSLAETLEQLTRDLVGLGEASRGVASLLGPEAARGLAARFEALETAVRSIEARSGPALDALQRLAAAQAAGVEHLRRLDAVEALLREQAGRAEAAGRAFERAAESGARGAAALETLVAAADRQQAAWQAHFEALSALVRGQADESRADRAALKRALAEFIR